MLEARAPWWMPTIEEGEGFLDYWVRIGFTFSEISVALTVDFIGAEDVANERLAHAWSLRNQREYETARDQWTMKFPTTWRPSLV